MTSLPAVLTRTRRLLAARRRWFAAGLTAVAVAAGLHVVSPPPPVTQSVVVAAIDVPAGTPLRAEHLRRTDLPDAAVPRGAVTSPDQLIGRVLVGPVRAGETLTDIRVVDQPLIAGYGGGRVAAPVRIADADAVALLQPGDRIDVMAADPQSAQAASVVATRAPVIVVPKPETGSPTSGSGALVVLAVSGESAKKLARAAVAGPLSIAIRE
ncbi:MAG: Flp pilus assembly protein CpaB [Nocardioidaceae bacterium]